MDWQEQAKQVQIGKVDPKTASKLYEFNLQHALLGFQATYGTLIMQLAPIEFVCTDIAFSLANRPMVIGVLPSYPDKVCAQQAARVNSLVSNLPSDVKYSLNDMPWKWRAASDYCKMDLDALY